MRYGSLNLEKKLKIKIEIFQIYNCLRVLRDGTQTLIFVISINHRYHYSLLRRFLHIV